MEPGDHPAVKLGMKPKAIKQPVGKPSPPPDLDEPDGEGSPVRVRLVPWENGQIGAEVTINGDRYACRAEFSAKDHELLKVAKPWNGTNRH